MNHFDRTQPNSLPPNNLPRRAATQAFTLIEILIVIALTAVLFALLLVPLISALRYTQQAQIVTAAQDAARITEERISRELGSAIFVFDGTSHPFQTANPIVAGDDRYTNFLDLQIPGINLTTGAYASTVAHAYNAKIDFVLPKANAGAVTDPTTQQSVNYTASQNGSAIISNPSLVFPLAAGTTMVRYWIGLKDPTKPYNNTREGKANGSDDNTYILYRAEFHPYNYNATPSAGKPAASANAALFAERPEHDSNGNVVKDSYGNIIYIPEIDDPDFFRYVSASDTDWLDDTHTTYGKTTLTAQDVASHNARVDTWRQISKVVIPGPNVDLILLPHNADNTLAYDGANGTFPGVAHSGAAHDPVSGTPGKSYPIINTSCTFRPATISGNATPGTTANYNSQGVVAADQAGFTYIPTVYRATSQSWSLPYHVSVYPGNYNQPPVNATAAQIAALEMYYDTEQFPAGQTPVTAPSSYPPPGVTNTPLSINPGDILEYQHTFPSAGEQVSLVYNVTQGYPVTYDGSKYNLGGTQFVPMTINPDTGTLSFTAPSLPNGPYDRLIRSWTYNALAFGASIDTTPGITADGTIDLTLPASSPAKLTDSPLQGVHTLGATGGPALTGVANAHIVPGSVRVTGPDQSPGPNNGQPVTYTEIKPSLNDPGDNQFYIDYSTSILHLKSGAAGPIGVIYDYQANMSLTTPLPATLPSTFTPPYLAGDPFAPYLPYLPMQVTVDYQTRDLIDVSIGVRIYDVTNNRAQVIPAETKIKIGNSNR